MLQQVRRGLAREAVGHHGDPTPGHSAAIPCSKRATKEKTPCPQIARRYRPQTPRRRLVPTFTPCGPAGLLFCSGQIPLDPATGELVGDTPASRPRQCLQNLEAVCDAAGTTLADAVQLTVYLIDLGAFAEVNEVYARSSSATRRPGWRRGRSAAAGSSGGDRRRGGPRRLSRRRSALAIGRQDIDRAARAGAGVVRETPVLSSRTLSERAGFTVALKAENLQRTGSFKLRGAMAKITSLGDGCASGVVTGSAGNHAQAVAFRRPHARSAMRGDHARGRAHRQDRSGPRARRAVV